MKTFIGLLILSFATTAYGANKSPVQGSAMGRTSKYGNETQYYKSSGSYNGRATTSGNQTTYYDSKGSYAGRAVTSGNTTRYYNARGGLMK